MLNYLMYNLAYSYNFKNQLHFSSVVTYMCVYKFVKNELKDFVTNKGVDKKRTIDFIYFEIVFGYFSAMLCMLYFIIENNESKPVL